MSIRIAPQSEVFPGYRLIERLGRGGFGEVWKAEAPGGMLKAIKFVYGNMDDATEDGKPAEQELKALNRVKLIRHPFILNLEQFKVVDGQLLIVMELADRNLFDRFRECQREGLSGVPRGELLGYLGEAAEALDLMNNHYQIQHLDIKPQNLFLIHNHIKVADFGLAKDMEGFQATLTGGVTPVYAAPETFEFRVSRFCDQYSLAIVYQEILTGHRPFTGATAKQLMMQHIQSAPDLSSLTTADQQIVRRALSKRPEDRFPTCAEFVEALREAGRAARAAAAHSASGPGAPSTIMVNVPIFPSPSQAAPAGSSLTGLNPKSGTNLPALNDGLKLPDLKVVAPRAMGNAALANAKEAPPEQTGPGALFPTLVVGVGQMGLVLLQRLRRAMRGRFNATNLPHVRFCFIDTDAETVQNIDSAGGNSLTPREIILAKLNRPSHYNRPGAGLAGVERWLNPQLLFRIPRNPTTTGIRAFGRLAFHDHYKTITGRLRGDLEAVLAPDALAEADKVTGLGLRTNRPRVYILAGLAGGTGGGMFLDLAYALRYQLRLMGYSQPDVNGLFLVPYVDRSTPKSQAIANAYAALAELAHYSAPNKAYEATFDVKEGTIVDRDRPFQQCTLLQLPKGPSGAGLKAVASLAVGYLFREMLSPFGRNADRVRTELARSSAMHALFQTVGTFRLAWPRLALLERSARRCAERAMQMWTAPETSVLAVEVASVVAEEWGRRQLSAELLLDQLRATTQATLRTKSPALFDGFLVSVDEGPRTDLAKEEVVALIDSLMAYLGQPIVAGQLTNRGTLHQVVDEAVQPLMKDVSAQVTEMAAAFLEQPGCRITRADLALNEVTQRVRTIVNQLEARVADPRRESLASYNRLVQYSDALDAANWALRRNSITRELVTELRVYARLQVDSVVLQGLCDLYRGVLNVIPDFRRDVTFLRQRVENVRGRFTAVKPAADIETFLGPGKPILPDGCRNVEAAAEQVADHLTADELIEFDTRIQAQIRKQFKTLLNCCLEKTDQSRQLAEAVLDQALAYLDPHFREMNTAAVFFQNRAQEQAAYRDVMHAYDEAAPDLIGPRARMDREICLLSVPDDPDGMRFARIAERTVTDTPVTTIVGTDDIVFHREQLLAATDLPQLGSFAKDSFIHITHTDQAAPHTRSDVNWLPVAKD